MRRGAEYLGNGGVHTRSEIRKGMQCDDTQRADDASIGGPAAEGGGVLDAWVGKFMVELPNQ